MAAALEGVELSLEDWVERIASLENASADDGAQLPTRDRRRITLVEGAGGLLSPLTATSDTRDLIRVLGADVLLVTANRLGTLNHTRLTFDALESHSGTVRAVVLSACDVPDASAASNAAELRRWLSVPIIELPWGDEAEASKRLGGFAEAISAAVMSGPPEVA